MNIDDRTYKRWLNLSKVVCKDNETAQDVLQELLLNIIEKGTCEDKLNDNYIFISLRNQWLSYLGREKRYTDEKLQDSEQDDMQLIYEADLEAQTKLISIEQTVMCLKDYEQKLYALHFIHGISQRKISRDTGISLKAINKRILKIKEKINILHYGKKTN